MFSTISKAWKIPEIRKRLFFTVLLIVIFRLGTHITVPLVDFAKLKTVMQGQQEGVLGLINLITGGAFTRLSIFALSISPYISASIIVQLLGIIVPSIEMMAKEGGRRGRDKLSKITKIVTLVLATLQSTGLYLAYSKQGLFENPGTLTAITVILTFVTGTMLLTWVGYKITSKGIGNGISMLIFAGIIASLPAALINLTSKVVVAGELKVGALIGVIAILMFAILVIAAVVYVHTAERKIPIQYSRKVVGRKMYGGQNTYIPIKLVMSGVMPVIFASSFMTFPAMLIQIFASSKIGDQAHKFINGLYNISVAPTISNVAGGYLLAHALIFMILIIAFAYFYTFAMYNPVEIESNIRQSGGYIPGIRTGKSTYEYLNNVIVKLTGFGAICLCAIAVLPMIINVFTKTNIALGGTSILIVVGVALESVSQLEAMMKMKRYKGFLE